MKIVATLALLLALCATGLAIHALNKTPTASVTTESAYDRVLRTGTLRCGYYVFPPVLTRDPNTNEFSGLSVDMMNRIGEKAGLKIEWTEEVSFASWPAALAANHFDAVCTPLWPDIGLGREALFTRPFMYSGLGPVVRADDHRFDDDSAKLNDPAITIVVQEGDPKQELAADAYPKAKLLVLPAVTDPATMMMNVMSGKADAILWDRNALIKFNGNNGAAAKMLQPDRPLKAQAFVLGVQQGEFGLAAFLDNAVAELLNTGAVDRLLTKWEPAQGTFLRVAAPYQVQAQP
jgi:ABC-type amino acid transport substrate-binding protein